MQGDHSWCIHWSPLLAHARGGASAGLIPDARIAEYRDTDPVRYERELKQARSLLFVAATRARDFLTITWHGTRSPFLRPSAEQH